MGRDTPRQYWSKGVGFDAGIRWVEGIYGDITRPKFSEVKNAVGDALWVCYFDKREDKRKIEQFKKDVKDIQEMTNRQEAATKYAARQVMAYLSDALYEGKGLPERAAGVGDDADKRRIFTGDGLWTSRLRREWGLFFDAHSARAKGLDDEEGKERKEKNRGDHHHHAIDAVVIALCTRQAPPEKRKEFGVVAMIVLIVLSPVAGVFGAILLMMLTKNEIWGALGFLFAFGVALLTAIGSYIEGRGGPKYNAEEWPRLYAEWERTCLCKRCGERFSLN